MDEGWICVIGHDCVSQQVSLKDALLKAHTFADLAGELPTQDVAILRLLLAVLHTVFSRVDEQGDDNPLETEVDAIRRWNALWKMGSFPEKPIRDYFDAWHERFWLFHPERPFYQVNDAAVGTAYTVAKLDGELSESNNKVKLFPVQTGDSRIRMDYAEATRWLIYQNAFDDNSSKPKGKSLPAPGIGWLGKLGLILAVGNNLFETLMLNLALLDDDRQLWPEENLPVWELNTPRTQERAEIAMPGNQAELLTLQSRRLMLQRENGYVIGYSLLGGDFFSKEDSISEMMTIWSLRENKNTKQPQFFQPKRHNPEHLIWQEFNAIITGNGTRRPGVVTWLTTLQAANCLPPRQMMRFRIASVQYGNSDYFATDAFSDELAMHANLLSELGAAWRKLIEEEIERCEECAKCVAWFSVNLERARGDRNGGHQRQAKACLHALIDLPFRTWLAELDAGMSPEERDKAIFSWRTRARAIALKLGEEMIAGIDNNTFAGRMVKEKKNGKDVEYHYSAPEAYISFRAGIYKIYPVNKAKQ